MGIGRPVRNFNFYIFLAFVCEEVLTDFLLCWLCCWNEITQKGNRVFKRICVCEEIVSDYLFSSCQIKHERGIDFFKSICVCEEISTEFSFCCERTWYGNRTFWEHLCVTEALGSWFCCRQRKDWKEKGSAHHANRKQYWAHSIRNLLKFPETTPNIEEAWFSLLCIVN